MKELNGFVGLPLGVDMMSGAGNVCWILGAAGLGLSLGSSLFGGIASRRAAKKAMKERRYRNNAERAWYEKEYNTDYLDTKAGQNLMRRAQEVQDNYIRKADGAAAVGGGTAAGAAMAKEAANRTMGDTVANIGARDTARKQEVSDRHMSNVQDLSREREAAYSQQAQNVAEAGQNMSNAMMGAAELIGGGAKKQAVQDGGGVPVGKTASDYYGESLLKKVTGV